MLRMGTSNEQSTVQVGPVQPGALAQDLQRLQEALRTTIQAAAAASGLPADVLRAHLRLAATALGAAARAAVQLTAAAPSVADRRHEERTPAVLTVEGARSWQHLSGQERAVAHDPAYDLRLEAHRCGAWVDVAVAGCLDTELEGAPRMSLNLFVDDGVPRMLVYGEGEEPVLNVCALPSGVALQRSTDATPGVDPAAVADSIRAALGRLGAQASSGESAGCDMPAMSAR